LAGDSDKYYYTSFYAALQCSISILTSAEANYIIRKNIKTKWGNRFIIAAIIQGGIITGMALATTPLSILVIFIRFMCLII
jgi:hypothetical protein